MIDKKFWQTIAKNWSKEDDGINIPEIKGEGIELIDPTVATLDAKVDEEIDDFMADLGLDDIEVLPKRRTTGGRYGR